MVREVLVLLSMAVAGTSAARADGVAADRQVAEIYAMADTDLSGALRRAEIAHRDHPDNAGVVFAHAWCLAEMWRLEDALAVLEEALAIDPEEPLYLYWLGFIQTERLEWAAARAAYERALELGLDADHAADARAKLELIDRVERASGADKPPPQSPHAQALHAFASLLKEGKIGAALALVDGDRFRLGVTHSAWRDWLGGDVELIGWAVHDAPAPHARLELFLVEHFSGRKRDNVVATIRSQYETRHNAELVAIVDRLSSPEDRERFFRDVAGSSELVITELEAELAQVDGAWELTDLRDESGSSFRGMISYFAWAAPAPGRSFTPPPPGHDSGRHHLGGWFAVILCGGAAAVAVAWPRWFRVPACLACRRPIGDGVAACACGQPSADSLDYHHAVTRPAPTHYWIAGWLGSFSAALFGIGIADLTFGRGGVLLMLLFLFMISGRRVLGRRPVADAKHPLRPSRISEPSRDARHRVSTVDRR